MRYSAGSCIGKGQGIGLYVELTAIVVNHIVTHIKDDIAARSSQVGFDARDGKFGFGAPDSPVTVSKSDGNITGRAADISTAVLSNTLAGRIDGNVAGPIRCNHTVNR